MLLKNTSDSGSESDIYEKSLFCEKDLLKNCNKWWKSFITYLLSTYTRQAVVSNIKKEIKKKKKKKNANKKVHKAYPSTIFELTRLKNLVQIYNYVFFIKKKFEFQFLGTRIFWNGIFFVSNLNPVVTIFLIVQKCNSHWNFYITNHS